MQPVFYLFEKIWGSTLKMNRHLLDQQAYFPLDRYHKGDKSNELMTALRGLRANCWHAYVFSMVGQLLAWSPSTVITILKKKKFIMCPLQKKKKEKKLRQLITSWRKLERAVNSTSRAVEFCGSWYSCLLPRRFVTKGPRTWSRALDRMLTSSDLLVNQFSLKGPRSQNLFCPWWYGIKVKDLIGCRFFVCLEITYDQKLTLQWKDR